MIDHYLRTHGGSKPEMPYQPGSHLVLSSHAAPMPVPKESYFDVYLSGENELERRYQHPLEICHQRGPVEGPANTNEYNIKVEITRKIRVADRHHAQVVLVKVLSVSETAPQDIVPGMEYAAKFYDPLYKDHGDGEDHWTLADWHYTTEVSAYRKLFDLQGLLIPTFYGSFSCEFRLAFNTEMMDEIDILTRVPPPEIKHVVRCILMEYIDGRMLSKIPQKIPATESKSLMKAILDTEAQIYFHNVNHIDCNPKNIILVEKGREKKLTAIFVDFADAQLVRCTSDQLLEHTNFFDGEYISPLLRWDISNTGEEYPGGDDWCTWVHFDWQEWLESTYGDDILKIDPHKLAEMRRTFTVRYFEN